MADGPGSGAITRRLLVRASCTREELLVAEKCGTHKVTSCETHRKGCGGLIASMTRRV